MGAGGRASPPVIAAVWPPAPLQAGDTTRSTRLRCARGGREGRGSTHIAREIGASGSGGPQAGTNIVGFSAVAGKHCTEGTRLHQNRRGGSSPHDSGPPDSAEPRHAATARTAERHASAPVDSRRRQACANDGGLDWTRDNRNANSELDEPHDGPSSAKQVAHPVLTPDVPCALAGATRALRESGRPLMENPS